MKQFLGLSIGLILLAVAAGLFAHGFLSLWSGHGSWLSFAEVVTSAFIGAAAIECIAPMKVK